MNLTTVVTLSLLITPMSLAMAHDKYNHLQTSECTINADKAGIVQDASEAENLIYFSGDKPFIEDDLQILSDTGYYRTSLVTFKLPHFEAPVLFGKLHISVFNARSLEEDNKFFNVILSDIVDLPLVFQSNWTQTEYDFVKRDVATGRLYGHFVVPPIDFGDVQQFEVPLSYDAIHDINANGGGDIGFGIANGEGWGGEAELIGFLSPDDGNVQLVLTQYGPTKKNKKLDSCEKRNVSDNNNSPPVLLITADKVGSGNYGWVHRSDGKKQWVDVECRARLEATGMDIAVQTWTEIDSIADGNPLPCEDI